MNHLHEVLSRIRSGDYWLHGSWSTRDKEVLDQVLDFGADSPMCFWLGELTDDDDSMPFIKLREVAELNRLPYASCWFEWCDRGEDGRLEYQGAIARDMSDGYRYWIDIRQVTSSPTICEVEPERPGLSLEAARKALGLSSFETVNVTSILARAFLMALNCNNVRRIETKPDAKLQKARAKRGKAPLFSYWTLELTGRAEMGATQGGTHASPRVHLRRGHPREYAPGLYTWVQPAIVGNKASGMVHKDYAAKFGKPHGDDHGNAD